MTNRRERVRLGVVVMSAAIAVLYLLIGADVVDLEGITTGEQAAFALPATALFAVGAVVAHKMDRRWVWITGTAGLAFIIFTYLNLASDRDPAYEFWGIAIRVIQATLLVALAYLAATADRESPTNDDALPFNPEDEPEEHAHDR